MGEENKASSVVAYLRNLVDKGRLTHGSAKPLEITLKKVLIAIHGEEAWGDVDVRAIDVSDYMDRFALLTRGTYSPGSLATYRSRLVKLLEWYMHYLEEPGWFPKVAVTKRSPRGAGVKKTDKPSIDPDVDIDKAVAQTIALPTAPSISPTGDLIRYPFPLSSGRMAEIALPQDFTKADAVRLANFISTLVIEEGGSM